MTNVEHGDNPLPATVYDIVTQQETLFKRVLSTQEISWNKECQFAIQALQSNEYLNDVAWNNKASLQNAIVNIASIGISLNPALKLAYLVPRKENGVGKVCLDLSYRGLLHLAQKSGSIVWGQSKLVYANDDYANTGVDTAPQHTQKTFGEKGDIIGAYCTVKLPCGDYLTEEMDIDTLNKIKEASKAANGPWKTWPDEMMRKCPVKRGYKYWPQNDRMSAATNMLDQQDGNKDPIDQSEISNHNTYDQTEVIKNYPQDEFEKNLPKWTNAVVTNRMRPIDLINMVETKGLLTEDQKSQINSIKKGS